MVPPASARGPRPPAPRRASRVRARRLVRILGIGRGVRAPAATGEPISGPRYQSLDRPRAAPSTPKSAPGRRPSPSRRRRRPTSGRSAQLANHSARQLTNGSAARIPAHTPAPSKARGGPSMALGAHPCAHGTDLRPCLAARRPAARRGPTPGVATTPRNKKRASDNRFYVRALGCQSRPLIART